MINAKELRIGNIVRWSGHIVSVNTGAEIDLMAPNAFPIDLTPEWLERSGFKIKHEASEEAPLTYAALRMDLDIVKEEEGYYLRYECQDSYYDCNIGVTIEYLHQLQNIYFALTGEELQIKMP